MSPYRCPVCGGRGLVAAGFYDGDGASIPANNTGQGSCRSCGGSGVVWSQDLHPGEYRDYGYVTPGWRSRFTEQTYTA